GRAETPANNVVAAQQRKHAANLVARHKSHVLQSHGDLLFVVGAQVGHVLFVGRAKKVPLGTVIARVAKALFEARIERDRVKRHLDVDRRRKLRAHAAHAFARGPLALRGLALNHKNFFAASSNKMIGDAGADNPSADEHDVCSVHVRGNCKWSCSCGDGALPRPGGTKSAATPALISTPLVSMPARSSSPAASPRPVPGSRSSRAASRSIRTRARNPDCRGTCPGTCACGAR